MSCSRCHQNNCSCPNVNCGCPPNYAFDPATNTCQGTTCEATLPTACIFSTTYLDCVKLAVNTDLQTVLSAMDAKICECGSCSGGTQPLPLFYVDSNNTETGDGSVGNPYKTIDLVCTAVVGTGTTASPEFTNATVYVMGGTYSTAQNIYIPSTNWTFFNGANVTFTGQGTYFIDNAAIADGAADFKVSGWINFKTSTGGFLRNSAGYTSNSINKAITIEAFKIIGNTTGTAQPLIKQATSNTGTGTGRNSTIIKMQGPASVIASASQHCIGYTGSTFILNLDGGSIYYGVDLIGSIPGSSSGNILNYNCNDTLNPGAAYVVIQNGLVGASYATDMFYVAGKYNTLRLDNLETVNVSNSNQPITFLNIATTNANLASGAIIYEFLLKDVYIIPSCFNSVGGVVIVYTAGGNSFNYLEMQNCVLYTGATIQFATIILGGSVNSGLVAGYNVINGRTNIYNLPTSAAGLATGTLWKNGAVINIV